MTTAVAENVQVELDVDIEDYTIELEEELSLEFGIAESQGRRQYMEDRSSWMVTKLGFGEPQLGIFGVYDGHGGDMASEYCNKNFVSQLMAHDDLKTNLGNAIEETVKTVDEEILKISEETKNYSGSTVNSVVILGRKLYCCNVGDSRAVLCRENQALALSTDHSALSPAEVKRVRKAGGFVTAKGVNNVITLSRAVGDLDLKGHKHLTFPGQDFNADLIVSDPDILELDIEDKDEFVIIGSDGLWSKMSNESAVKLAKKNLDMFQDPERCAKMLVKAAFDAGSMDNITAIVVQLHEFSEPGTKRRGNLSNHFFNRSTRNISTHGGGKNRGDRVEHLKASTESNSTPSSPTWFNLTSSPMPTKDDGSGKRGRLARRNSGESSAKSHSTHGGLARSGSVSNHGGFARKLSGSRRSPVRETKSQHEGDGRESKQTVFRRMFQKKSTKLDISPVSVE